MKASGSKLTILIFLVVIISIILSIFVFNLFPRKLTGSFEYVRKGEELLDKGRHVQAITYFERAYKSSPGNDAIKSSLVWAYSMYSGVLAKEDKHDEAIMYLEKAYNVTPNSSTMQNLSFAYSEKALHEAGKGALAEAKNNYAKAIQYASESPAVSRNLGVMLYNDGVDEFRSGREDIAILCFKESSTIYKEARTFEMLGDMYYKRAELKKARYYWHMAMSLNPNNVALSEKMGKIGKEMALAAREKESEITHFEIRYTKDLPIDKELAARTLEKAYVDIGKDLGYFPEAKTKIFFYSKEDFVNTFKTPYFVKAFYDGSIKMPAPQNYLDREKFATYIYHEYTHAIVSAKTKNNCPTWLSEGIAVWEEFKKEKTDVRKITVEIKKVPEISFKFLDGSFKTDEITADKALCYILSYTLVDFIVNNWGMQGLQGVLKRLAGKQHIANAIDDEFLISEGEFEKNWRDYAMEKYF
ncbi:MAG: peptidase MA family metallohydrolase [Candidatus Omnitrophota bacterium]|nr:peptidase MA family metallohydrolase [Candidatus Omnitrophota bacterium]